jgi:hypothetical protein
MSDREATLAIIRDAEIDGRSADAATMRAELGQLHGIEELLGKTLASVVQNGSDSIDFVAVTGERW